MNKNTLVIANTKISRDFEGRFSLNDLHKASGALKKDAPNKWLENKQTKDLIAEISQTPNSGSALKVQNGGKNQGTYACEELAVAYASWISPSFHLLVLRTFIAVHKKENSSLTAKEVGGVSKKVFAKQFREFLPELMREFKNYFMPMTGQSVVFNYKTSRELLEEHGAIQKGRKALVLKVTYELKKICESMGVAPIKDFYSNTLRFPPEVYTPFFKGTGSFWIKQHNAFQLYGQRSFV